MGKQRIDGSAGGLQKPFAENLNKDAQTPDAADADVGCTAGDGLRNLGLHGVVVLCANHAKDNKHGCKTKTGKDTVSGCFICLVAIVFAQ